jgi:hypothetical protein
MANTVMTILYNGGTPGWQNAPGVTQLAYGDTVTINPAGFPGGGSVAKVQFFRNTVVNGQDQKDTSAPAGEWTAANGSSGLTAYSVAGGASPGSVVIQDIEQPTADDKFWFGVTVHAGSTDYPLDPELINKKT